MQYWDCDYYASKPIATLSHGMQKRIGLAIASLHDPELLILDEPFSGLDLFHIKALEDEVKNRKKRNLTTIVSTHIAPYVARLCDDVFIVDSGQVSTLSGWQEADHLTRVDLIEAKFFAEGKATDG